MAYDAIGQLLQETQQLRLPTSLGRPGEPAGVMTKAFALAHRYDALGNRVATTLPNGRTLNHLFYGAGHLHHVNLDGEVVSDIERDALHREVCRSQGRLLSEYAYDPAGRLTAQRVRLAQAGAMPGAGQAAIDPHTGRPTRLTGLIERRYGYDAAGQLRQWLDRERGLTQYAYDPVGRIVGSWFGVRQQMQAPSVSASPASATRSEHFHWDAASNSVPPPTAGQPVRQVTGNRLLVWQDEAYRYDAHGNLTERLQGKRGSAAQTHTRLLWDGAHQLVQASLTRGAGPGATTQDFAYAYDALGRRVAKIDAFGTTAFAWDGDRMLLEQRARHEVLHLYEPESFVPLAQVHGGVVHHLHTDHLGTPLEASNDAGDITWRVTYRTWGSVVVEDVAEIAQRVRFQGQYLDVETGLHYNRFRYYEPGAGRFVSQDPIGLEGGFHAFRYAANPIEWVDPLGLEKLKSAKTIRFSQNSYSGKFSDGGCVNELAHKLKSNPDYAKEIEPIRPVKLRDLPFEVREKMLAQGASKDMVFSLDNRRLGAAKMANGKVNTRWATKEEIENIATARRFSTKNAGKSACPK